MPVLPVLGHKPITSYFSRTPSTKRKRKEFDKPGSSSTEGISKRPKQSASSSFRPTTGDIGDGLKVTKWTNGSPRDEVESQCTPLTHSGNPSLDGTLPTPPMTCIAPFRSRKGSEKEPSSSPQRSEPSCQKDNPEDILFSAPLLPPKDHKLFNSTIFQPPGTSASLLVVSNVTPTLTIPSSQSQDTPCMEVDILTSFSGFSGKFSSLRPTGGEDLVVESSQSQLLIMAPPNMRKLEWEPTPPAFDVVIPSSQSQEKELSIPTEKEIETGTRGRFLVGSAQIEIENPQGTLSDELFSVPIRDSILDNLFSDEQAPDIPVAWDNPDSSNLVDSETEDEHEGFPNKERSLDPTSFSPAARASSVSRSSLGIGSYSSLPPEVWEFRKMFENDDESYPADFPESLRS